MNRLSKFYNDHKLEVSLILFIIFIFLACAYIEQNSEYQISAIDDLNEDFIINGTLEIKTNQYPFKGYEYQISTVDFDKTCDIVINKSHVINFSEDEQYYYFKTDLSW